MAREVIMPRFGMTQEEATIVRWIVQDGQQVEYGDPLCEVTTDKVNMEVEAPADGILGGIRFEEGVTVLVTEVIAFILEEGEAVPEVVNTQPRGSGKKIPLEITRGEKPVKATPVATRMAEQAHLDLSTIPGTGNGGKITRQDVEDFITGQMGEVKVVGGKVRASPAARRIARERGVGFDKVRGSGPRGRIQGWDLNEMRKTKDTLSPGRQSAVIQLQGIRRTIAERMQGSWQNIPHITFSLDIDMSRAIAMRQLLNARLDESEGTISISAVLIKACAAALGQHPLLNSYFRDGEILMHPDVNIGLAVALEEGLIVPVIHHADRKGLFQIAEEVGDLSRRARTGDLQPGDVVDGTFTISNLGMYAVDQFTAIINPPQVAILAVGRIADRFMPDETNRPELRPMMTITLSVDHRVVDGVAAARFLSTLQGILETAGAQWG